MKVLTSLVFLASMFAVACGNGNLPLAESAVMADTSGCSPLLSRNFSTNTARGNSLGVDFQGANSADCWNANQSDFYISYRWTQKSNEIGKVLFWIRADGQEKSLVANVSCSSRGNSDDVDCKAGVNLRTVVRELEIAPVHNGQWDTAGFGQNYKFKVL